MQGGGEKLSLLAKAVGTGVRDSVGAVEETRGKLQEAGEKLAAPDRAKFGAWAGSRSSADLLTATGNEEDSTRACPAVGHTERDKDSI